MASRAQSLMVGLYRPALHQISVVRWEGAKRADVLSAVERALEHGARDLDPETHAYLRKQLESHRPDTSPALKQRDLRYPLVRSAAMYDVPGQPGVQAAFNALQVGTDVLAYGVWQYKDSAAIATFGQLKHRIWSRDVIQAPNYLGEGFLLTAALEDVAPDPVAVAEEMLSPFGSSEANLIAYPLGGATVFLRDWSPVDIHPWYAAVLFQNRNLEATRAADRFASVDWLLVVRHFVRLEHNYLTDYRASRASGLANAETALRAALHTTFDIDVANPDSAPRFMATRHPQPAQRALTQLSGPQFTLLQEIEAAELCPRRGRLDLGNLEQASWRAAGLALPVAAPRENQEALVNAICQRGRQWIAQMESDVEHARLTLDRAASAVQVLATHVNVLQAWYERKLAWVIGVVGAVLAMGQLLGGNTAALVYHELGVGWVWESFGGRPLKAGDDDPVLLYVLALGMSLPLIVALLGWLVSRTRYR
jgi:hypothetical protein